MNPTGLTIVEKETPVPADVQAIITPLAEYNKKTGPPTDFKGVVLTLEADGNIVGGLWGKCAYDWLHIEAIVVPAEARGAGIGRELMQRAESLATRNSCVGVHLSTLEFQAKGFYEKLGYTVFGELQDFPASGGSQYFMRKRL